MLIDLISVILLTALSGYLFICGNFETTKEFGFVPLAISILDLMTLGDISYTSYPILAVLLFGIKLAAAGVSLKVLHMDRIASRKRSARRREAKRQETMQTVSICAVKSKSFAGNSVECA